MAENKYFREALSSFAADVAYVGAVRHLYDAGYSEEQIRREIAYPVSIEQIRKVIADYEAEKNSPAQEYEYVQDTDAYGKKSFRRVKKK